MADAENMGVRVDWIDRVIGEILKARDHRLVLTVSLIRERTEVLQRQLNVLADELNQVENQMADKDIGPSSSGDYVVQILWRRCLDLTFFSLFLSVSFSVERGPRTL